MFELSDERIRKDEIELYYYGCSSTQVYIHYRQAIDSRLKTLMVQISQFYEEKHLKDPEDVDQTLMEQYNAFWTAAEPTLQKFYEDIQNALALPKDLVTKSLMTPQEVFCYSESAKIDKEIQSLEDQYQREIYYLHALEQRKEAIENNCIPVKNQIDLVAKLLKDIRKVEYFDVLEAKRVTRMEKYLETIDKTSVLKCMWAGGASDAKEKENMKNFMEVIDNNENGS